MCFLLFDVGHLSIVQQVKKECTTLTQLVKFIYSADFVKLIKPLKLGILRDKCFDIKNIDINYK